MDDAVGGQSGAGDGRANGQPPVTFAPRAIVDVPPVSVLSRAVLVVTISVNTDKYIAALARGALASFLQLQLLVWRALRYWALEILPAVAPRMRGAASVVGDFRGQG